MDSDFKRREPTSSPFSPYYTPRIYQENIFDDYMNVWDLSPSIFNDKLRSYEHKLIKLDKIELEDLLQQYVRKSYHEKNAGIYTSCVLLHLIHVFCIPGQEEKMEVVQVKLNKVLHTSSEKDRYNIFAKYLSQQLKVKRNLTEIDFLNGQIDPQAEFELKLCYWNKIYYKNNTERCKEFLNKNVDFLVSNIERMASNYYSKYIGDAKLIHISCKILLCLLNWNICQTQTTVILHNREAPDSSSVAGASVYCTVYKFSNILQKLLTLLIFYEDYNVITIFNNYLEQMYAKNLEITEDVFCTGKIQQNYEFQLKLCYCEKLCDKNDDETFREFLRRNADLFVSQIEEVVHFNKTKTKHVSCKVLLCMLNWNICDLKSTLTQSKIQNNAIQEQSKVEDTTKKTCTMYKARCVLQNLLSTLTDNETSEVFNDYIDQMYTIKSEITPDGLCIGETGSNHEYQLKLCYWTIICRKNDNKAFKKFIQLYPEVLVSDIKKRIVLCEGTKTKRFFCKILLCILNWNICTLKKVPLLVKNAAIQASSSVVIIDDSPPKYSEDTEETIRSMLQSLLSTFSEEEIFTAFNNYLDILYAINSEITEDDFCTGKIEPYHEFLLKLCYCEKLCNKNDETYNEFLRRNAYIFVSQIETLVDGNKVKLKRISCTILLRLLNLNMCTLKTTPLMVQNTELQACPSDASVADTSTKYYYTAKTIWRLLKTLLLTLSDDDMFTTFNNYLGQLYAINSEITEEDLCTGKIEPYHEFLLKLCYCEKLCNKMDDEIYKEFLRRNADYLVTQIEEVVHGNKITKLASCKVLLHLLNWNICTLKSTLTQSKIQNNAIKEQCSLQSEERDTTKESCTMYKVRCVLQNLLSTLTNDDIMEVFNDYIDQMYTIKSELSPDGLCIGQTGSNHEYQLKLCYWTTICRKNDNKAFKKFIQLYPEVLVSDIKKRIVVCQGTKTKRFFCKILLCILNWNICTLKKVPLLVKNAAIQASSSVVIIDDSPPKYSEDTEETIRSMLQSLLSTFSEEEIFTALHNYLDILFAMNSEITEDDFCTGKIELYHEFLLKLCYCEKLFIKKDEKKMKKFLSRNADFLVSQIGEGVNGGKTQVISCKVLLCLSKWGISNSKTAFTSHKDILSRTLTFNTDNQDFVNENALFLLSMVSTVMKKNNIAVLINLCDVLLSIPYNGQHFHDIIGAVQKLIRYFATQVGMNIKILEWIIKLRYRVLRHQNQKLDTAIKIEIDFHNLFNLLDDLLTDLSYNSRTLERANTCNSFKCFTSQYDYFASHYHSEEEGFASHCQTMELFETRLRELWIAKIKCKVKATQTSNKIRNKGRENLIPMEFLQTNTTMSEQDFIYEWKADLKKNQKNIKKIEAQLKEMKMVDKRMDEMVKKLKLYEMLLLSMMTLIVMVGVSNGHHKSAKLKKYLSLKYEYATASLYLLWCSGDIEVHPGPSPNKKSLVHDSTIERRWIQNISPKIINRLPEHEQSKYKPTKKVRNDMENREQFKTLLKTCFVQKVHVPKMYLAEINAWETMEYTILHKLFIYRCEIETIITSLEDFLTCGGRNKDLTDINITFYTDLKIDEIAIVLGKDQRPTDKSQLMVYITRYIAGVSIKCAHKKDPDAKCDGLWDIPLKKWPKDIILFDPNNRGKYSKKHPGTKLIPDQELVDMLLKLPQVTIPPKYKDIVEAFRTMRKSQKDKSINKQHKAELCCTFKRITSLEKLEYALKNLWESGIFTEEVHNNLNKWWTTRAVETTDDKNFSQVDINDAGGKERPHIAINISTKSITLTVEQTDANSSQVSYDFPFKDECVPLKKSQAIFDSNIKHQHKISTEETALCSTIDFDQPTSSTKQINQLNQNIATQSTTNSDDNSSATKNSQSLEFHTQVSPTSDLGSPDSISSVTSKSGNEDGDKINIPNGSQVLLTDSDYSSDSSNNCVSKTNMQKRKFKEEDSNETKKRKIPSQEDKKPIETNHRQMDCLMDNTASFNKNREILPDWLLDIDLDSYDIDDQTFKVDLNALDNEDNELVKFLQDMINCESAKKCHK